MKTYLATQIGKGVVLETPTADGTVGQVIQTDGNGLLSFVDQSGGAGEANTGSNVGTLGIGVFDDKVGVDLQFRNINGVDGIVPGLDAPNNNIDIGLASAVGDSLKGNTAAIGAATQDLQSADITTEGTPAAGMFAVGFGTGGALVKYDVSAFLGGGGGTPGGNDTELQFNNSGAFEGAAALTYASDVLLVNAQGATDIPFVVRGALGQTADLTQWQQSDTTVGARITAAGEFSNQSSSTNPTAGHEKFGAGATTAGSLPGVAFGKDAVSGSRSVAMGGEASQSGDGVSVGYQSTSGSRAVAVGMLATVTGSNESMAFGQNANCAHNHSVAFGRLSATTATDQFMIGGTTFPMAIAFSDLGGDPPALEANIYGKDVTGTRQVWVQDSAGAGQQISPHDQEGNWIHNSKNQSGKRLTVHMEKLIRHLAAKDPELAQFIEES